MKKKIMNTHFTLETRTIIENELNEGKSVTEIAKILQRSGPNVGREIIKHRQPVFPSTFNNYHPCVKHDNCSLKGYECYKNCKMLEVNLCPKLTSAPHVCNGCNSKKGCRHVKYYYNAKDANSEYLNSWVNDRTGLQYTEEELSILNNDFKNLVLNCKSIYHALIVINARGFNFKSSTIYKQIEQNKLELKSSDLPRHRKQKKYEKKDTSYKQKDIDGHTYEDYVVYKEEHSTAVEMQMDTVEGTKENNAPVMLTLEIIEIKFLFIFKITEQTIDEVAKQLNYLRGVCGDELIDKIFEILLTDNGKEFTNYNYLNEKLPNANIFYCHPYSSFEKGNIENNHELIRRVIPKYISLKPYTQQDYNLLCSHINSLYRQSLDEKCPFDLINNYIPDEVLDRLNIRKIKDTEVMLVPALLGQKNIDNIKKHLDKKEIKGANIVL